MKKTQLSPQKNNNDDGDDKKIIILREIIVVVVLLLLKIVIVTLIITIIKIIYNFIVNSSLEHYNIQSNDKEISPSIISP